MESRAQLGESFGEIWLRGYEVLLDALEHPAANLKAPLPLLPNRDSLLLDDRLGDCVARVSRQLLVLELARLTAHFRALTQQRVVQE